MSRYQCDICERNYVRKIDLENHIIKFHLSSLSTSLCQYQCDICGRKYLRKYDLKKHITKFHLSLFCVSSVLPNECGTLKYTSTITYPSGTLRITLSTVDINTIHKWIEEYGHLNNAVYVRTTSKKNKNKTTVYYEKNNCQHYHKPKNENRKKRTKGRECSSKILVSVKTTKVSEITILEKHNHSLDSAEILHYRKPTEAVKNQFEELFNSGLGPTAAYNNFADDIEKECCSNNEWMREHCDRSKVPDLPWVHKFFKKKFEEKYGPQGNNFKKFLKDKQEYCRFKEVKGNFVIAICTPLMQRVSRLSIAGELFFVDSTGGVDRYGFKVFPLIVNTNAGGCPIGVLLTTCETKEVISEALSLYLTLVDEKSFGGRGKQGPKCVITNDCQAEIQALKDTFPETTLLLCIFHFLKAIYRWLLSFENGVKGKDRLLLYNQIKKMVYAKTEEQLQIQYSILLKIPSVEKNKVQCYFQKEYEKRKQWALCYRYTNNIITRSSYINNCAERAMHIIKDEILNRRKSLCPSQLVDYFTIAYDNRYKHTLINIAINKDCSYLKRKSKIDVADFEKKYATKKLMENIFEVMKKNGKVLYYIDAEIGCCSCYVGISGGLCNHIKFVTSKFQFNHPLQFPNSSAEKQNLYYIATGEIMAQEFFKGPTKEEVNVSSVQDGVKLHQDDVPNFSYSKNKDQTSATEPVSNVGDINSSFTSFIQEVNVFCKKFEGQANVNEALNQATDELKKLQNGTAAKAISALKCFNRNLSYCNLHVKNSRKIGVSSTNEEKRKCHVLIKKMLL